MTLSTQDVHSIMIADGSDVEIPSDFICPITLEVMVDPLMTRTGFNFERAAILGWLEQGSGSCPLTREPLATSDLTTNRRLKTHICMWKANNGWQQPLTLVSLLPYISDHIIPPPSSPQRAEVWQSRDQRCDFLSSILTSAIAELDDL
jgi:hypothetical protein